MGKWLIAAFACLLCMNSAHAVTLPGFHWIGHHAHLAAVTAKHRMHLERAMQDIAAAEVAGKAGRFGQAEKDTAAAIHQIRSAMAHHKHYRHLHVHHHSHLESAVKDLQAAEKQFKLHHVPQAEKDLARAAIQIRESVALHVAHRPASTIRRR